jgi:hypothetical protein
VQEVARKIIINISIDNIFVNIFVNPNSNSKETTLEIDQMM